MPVGMPPGTKIVQVTHPRIKRAIEMRKRGMSYPAISAAMAVYEGEAPCASTLRRYILAAGMPKMPRGRPLNGRIKKS